MSRVLLPFLLTCSLTLAADSPWPADVAGHKPPEPGEHPRLLFRKADLPHLREKANTPEGQVIIKRLRAQLDGKNGDTMTTEFNPQKGPVSKDGAGTYSEQAPLGAFTISHAAGYGMLYQLTGDNKYADLGRQCFEKALEGYRDRDTRYSFKAPFGALRAGPSLGWMAVGYDLCYDGWDDATRRKLTVALAGYNEGQYMSLADLVAGKRHKPGSNHWGMQVGGGAMAALAVMNDPGTDVAQIDKLLEASQKSMIRNMTEGFGDGTGSMSSHIIFLSALQAWRNAGGKDFVAPRPNAQWMALKWIFLSVPDGADPKKWFWPGRGGYPHNIWDRDGKSGGGYFAIPFGVLNRDQNAALLWFYNKHVRPLDDNAGAGLDAPSPYPHHSVLAFVNWPVGLNEKNPGDVLPHAYRDTKFGFYAWRNRWQDKDDTVISILTRTAKGNMSAKGETTLSIMSNGKRFTWGVIDRGFTGDFTPAKDGSTILTTGNGSILAIDFGKASGADAVLLLAGPSATKGDIVEVGGVKVAVLVLGGGDSPKPRVEGETIRVGARSYAINNGKLVVAPPL